MNTIRKLPCPSCHNRRLQRIARNGIQVDVCPRCAGVWLDHYELDLISKRYDPSMLRDATFLNKYAEESTQGHKQCPVCKVDMPLYKITKPIPIEIDVCETCSGIWLDKGELDQAQILNEVPKALNAIDAEPTKETWLLQFLWGIPVEFNIRARKFPYITWLLIIVNGMIYLREYNMLSVFGEARWYQDMILAWGLIPGSFGTLPWIFSLFSHQFLHGDAFHLLGNMYFLYIFGDNVEDAIGRSRFLMLYLVCGVAGGLLQTMSDYPSLTPAIGASGAIAGIMSAYAVIFRRAHVSFMVLFWQWKLPVYTYFAIWVGTNIVGAINNSNGVGWFAHLGGFITGLITALLIYNWVLDRNPLLKHLNTTIK